MLRFISVRKEEVSEVWGPLNCGSLINNSMSTLHYWAAERDVLVHLDIGLFGEPETVMNTSTLVMKKISTDSF